MYWYLIFYLWNEHNFVTLPLGGVVLDNVDSPVVVSPVVVFVVTLKSLVEGYLGVFSSLVITCCFREITTRDLLFACTDDGY